MKNRNLLHSDNWATPKAFYNELNKEFRFTFDPCPLHSTVDNLKTEWGKRNYINPPYSQKLKEAFVLKAIEESRKGKLCVMLLPVSTSTKLFHYHITPNAKEIRFVRGRIKFLGVNTKGEYVTNKSPMHDSMIVVFYQTRLNPNSKQFPKLNERRSEMGWIKKEAKAFGRELTRQGSILLFGKAPKHKPHRPRKITGAEHQYRKAQRWAKRNGFK